MDRNALAMRRLRRILRAAVHLRIVKILGEVELRIVNGAEIRALNRRYLGKRGLTDVLSFPAPLFFQRQGFWGSIVICWPVLVRQARAHKHSAQAELDLLITHGLLHVWGYDHEKSRWHRARMQRLEKKILTVLYGARVPSSLLQRT